MTGVTIPDKDYVMSRLPKRSPEAHKGDFGRILLLCGSVGYTGAAELAANAAMRCGAGLVYVGVPEAVYPIVAGKLTEPMVFPLPAESGMLSEAAIPAVLERMESMDAVLIGPGLGQSVGVRRVVRAVLRGAKCPVVVDADGINALSEHTDVLRKSACDVILTPHPGEFARLGGQIPDGDRQRGAAELARRLGCVCVLKGRGTVVTDGDAVLVNPTGNPGMATGGSGDVLAGMLTALLGQGMAPMDAAAAAVWLHGAAGDLCARETGQMALIPSDLIGALCRLLP